MTYKTLAGRLRRPKHAYDLPSIHNSMKQRNLEVRSILDVY